MARQHARASCDHFKRENLSSNDPTEIPFVETRWCGFSERTARLRRLLFWSPGYITTTLTPWKGERQSGGRFPFPWALSRGAHCHLCDSLLYYPPRWPSGGPGDGKFQWKERNGTLSGDRDRSASTTTEDEVFADPLAPWSYRWTKTGTRTRCYGLRLPCERFCNRVSVKLTIQTTSMLFHSRLSYKCVGVTSVSLTILRTSRV